MIVALILAAVLGPGFVSADVTAVRSPPALAAPTSARCPDYWPLAAEVGWPVDQLAHVDRVMACESRCQPDAYNPSGASGLMQVLARYFPAGADPFDPATNLSTALDVWHAQGWRAWSCR